MVVFLVIWILLPIIGNYLSYYNWFFTYFKSHKNVSTSNTVFREMFGYIIQIQLLKARIMKWNLGARDVGFFWV